MAALLLSSPASADWRSKRTKDRHGVWVYHNAMPELRAAADVGDAEAQVELAGLIQNGRSYAPQDEAGALRYYEKAAASGNLRGLSGVAHAYLYGRGVARDCARSQPLYKELLSKGDLGAASTLEQFSAGRAGRPKCPAIDPEKLKGYTRLINLSIRGDDFMDEGDADPAAKYEIGWEYAEGDTIDRNDEQALAWFRRSAEGGYAGGLWALGWFHQEGRGGLKKDRKEALRWYRKAAEMGHKGAWVEIGIMHANGEGVKPDPAEAILWYRKAAEAGLERGQHELGSAYRDGKGLPKDELEAYRWLRLAARQGCKKAAEEAERIAASLSPEKLAEAQSRAGEAP